MDVNGIDRRRDEFPSLASGVHLLSHSLGPVPRSAREAMLGYLDRWKSHGSEDAWASGWWDLSREVGDRIAVFLGALSGSVQIQPSATSAMSTVASCFDFRGNRNRVVTTALDFPSMGYLWQQQDRVGAEVDVVPSDDGISIDPDRLLDAIDERTALVAVCHTSYRSSYRLDPVALVERARDAGALVALDVYQSAGILELDAEGWGVDFMVGGTIKWMCGGPACGYLYVRPALIPELQPRLTGWIAHEQPFEFSGDMRYATDVRRFAQGTPSIPALYSCLPGLRILKEIGLDVIASESRRRTRWMVGFILERGWKLTCPADDERRGGTVTVDVGDPGDLVEQLAARRVYVDSRPGAGLRISPHFFNTDEEVEQALKTLTSLT